MATWLVDNFSLITAIMKSNRVYHSELFDQFSGMRPRMYNVRPHDYKVIETMPTE